MTLGDNVAVVALIVSLIALIVTFLSVTQTFLATADGYRRCAQSVLGPWSKFRHRRWIWYEFRYETRFVSPEIILVSRSQISDAQNDGLSAYRLIDPGLEPGTVLDNTIHDKTPKIRRQRRTLSDPKDLAKLERTLRTGTIGRRTRNLIGLGVETRTLEQEMPVSWLRLLKELHGLYYDYWPQDCKQCQQDRDEPRSGAVSGDVYIDAEKGLASGHHSSTPRDTVTETNRTDAAIIYRSWTWDFLPPDIVKPLAMSTVGDIVILARRLGMQWRTLRLAEGIMQADGNGFSLSSTDMKNLGMVFTFKTVGRQDNFARIVPTALADKLLCGILPGDPELVKQEFPTVRNNREIWSFDAPGGVFEKLGLKQPAIDRYKHAPLPEPPNEAIVLTCEFLPLSTCDIASVHIDALRANGENIFTFWEGRIALYSALKTRIANCPNHARIDDLKATLAHFDTLKEFHDDFFCLWNTAALTNHQKKNNRGFFEGDPSRKSKKSLIQTCRRIFDATTKYFIGHGLTRQYEGHTWYKLLVAAHLNMVIELIPRIYHEKFPKGKIGTQEELFQQYSQGFPYMREGFRGVWIVPSMIEYVRGYAIDIENGVRHHDRGIAALFSRRGLNFSTDPAENMDQCEALWWMLTVRGVAWTMSCYHSSRVSAGMPVPPIYYNDKTPVWIT